MEDIGVERTFGRRLVLAELTNDWVWREPAARGFTLFIAADASATNDEVIEAFATEAFASGCDYVCAWGPGCERVHDLFDEVELRVNPSPLPSFMSTWHADESLAQALYFALVLALPDSDADRPRGDRAAVVLAVQQPWLDDVRLLLTDQEELARRFDGQ